MKNKSVSICVLAALALIAHCYSTALANTNTNSTAAIPVIRFEDVELTTVIENLARQAEINHLFDPKTALDRVTERHQKKQPRVSLSWTNLTALQSLTGVLAYYGLHLVEIKGTTVSKITLTNLTVKPVDIQWIQQGTNWVIPLIQMGTVPLDDALRNLARSAKLNMTIEPINSSQDSTSDQSRSAPPILSLRWEAITARQAIAALCENYDLVMTHEETTGGTVKISRPERPMQK